MSWGLVGEMLFDWLLASGWNGEAIHEWVFWD